MLQYILVDKVSQRLYETEDNKIILFDNPQTAMMIGANMSQALIVNGVQVGEGFWEVQEYIPSLFFDCEFVNFSEIQKEANK